MSPESKQIVVAQIHVDAVPQKGAVTENVSADFMVATGAKISDFQKICIARQCLHRYIFIICHTIHHFGYHLNGDEVELVEAACHQTLQWLWHCNLSKSLDALHQRILQLRKICTPYMQKMFHIDQRAEDGAKAQKRRLNRARRLTLK